MPQLKSIGLWILSLAAGLHFNGASAYVLKGTETQIHPKTALEKAKLWDLDVSLKEQNLKSEILETRSRNAKEFQEQLENKLMNPPQYQGYLYEVRDGHKKIERAKELARVQIFKVLRENWLDVKKTVLNDTAATNWDAFSVRLRRRLENIIYLPSQPSQSQDGYRFQIEDWGTVTVQLDTTPQKKGSFKAGARRIPNPAQVHWKLDIASHHDGNRLQDGVELITTSE